MGVMYNLIRALVGGEGSPPQASVSACTPSRTSSLDNLLSVHSSAHMGTGDSSTADDSAAQPQHEDLVAMLWEAKWFGSTSGPSEGSSRQNGSPSSSDAPCCTASHHRGSSPIIFSSRKREELPPPCVTRQRNTPLAPSRLQPSGSMGLGTWTTRQTTFLEEVPENAAAGTSGQAGDRTPGSIVADWLRQQAAQQQANGAEISRLQTEDAVEDAAWRWRFARRWHAEQTRDIDPGSVSASDKVDDNRYLGGQGWNMQQRPLKPEGNVARTASTDLDSSLVKNGSIVGVDLLLFDSDGGWAVSRGDRTLTQQGSARSDRDREQRALRVWDAPCATDMSLLPAVEIDGWGAFRFLLLKLCDVLDGQDRLLVHGHNHCTDASLVEGINRKVMQATGMPTGAGVLLALGGGIMEWRRDRQRCLHMHSGYILNTTHREFTGPSDVLNLTAELVRDSLPPGYTVMVGDGQ